MKIETKKLDKLKRTIRIQVSGDEFIQEKEQLFRQKAKSLKVPGFRPGSAPLDVVEKHHGKLLKEEFLKQSLPLFYQKALQQEGITPATLPNISDVEMLADRISFSAEFEARPQLEIKENIYKGIVIKTKTTTVEAIEIEKAMTTIKENIKKATQKDLADDSLAKWTGYADSAALREAIRLQLGVEKLRASRQDVDAQVKQHLLKNAKVDVPKGQLEQHHKELVDRELYSLQYRGVGEADIEKYKSEIENKLKTAAEDDVKLFYIFEAIAKQENIAIDKSMADTVLGFVLSEATYK